MIGKVTFFNVVKSLGFVEAELTTNDRKRVKKKYFVHSSSIKTDEEFRVLLPKDEVEFEPMADRNDRWQAARVRLINRPGATVTVNPKAEFPFMVGGIVSLVVNGDTLELLGKGDSTAIPFVSAKDNFRVYRLGHEPVSDFALDLPASTKDEAVVLLDPDKHPRRPVEPEEGESDIGNFYLNIKKGSYLLHVKRSGEVTVECMGNVYYGERSMNYLVVQRRFHHNYGSLEGATEKSLLEKTPTSGLDRDNDGFVRGILRGIQMMDNEAASALSIKSSTT